MSNNSSTCHDLRQLRQQQLHIRQREQATALSAEQRHALNNHLAKLETALWLLENAANHPADMDYGAAASLALGDIEQLLSAAGA